MRIQTWLAVLAALMLVLGACSDDAGSGSRDTGADGGGDGGVDGGGDTGPDMLPDTGPDADAAPDTDLGGEPDLGDTTPPVISDALLTENASNQLSALVAFDTDEEAEVWLVADDGDGHTVTTPRFGPATEHDLFLMGVRAEATYIVTIWAEDAAGNQSSDDSLTFETVALEDFPPMELLSADESVADDGGYYLFNVFRLDDEAYGLLVIVDRAGEIVWYYLDDDRLIDARVLDNGNIVYGIDPVSATEIDVAGNIVNEWEATSLSPPTDSMHHEIFPMPNGNFLTLSSELRNIDGYPDPDNEGEFTDFDVVADVVVEFEQDGDIVTSHSLFDVLEEYHLVTTSSFNGGFWNNHYAEDAPEGTKDWSHGNAVVYDEATGLDFVSARHLNWVVALDHVSGDLVFRMGCGGDLTLTNGTADEGCDPEWQYHQHALEVQDDGSILLFDNGNGRPGTGTEEGQIPPYSRAARFSYDITSEDEAEWTATLEWEFVVDAFSGFISDADRLPSGNIMVTAGGIMGAPGHARMIEVTDEETPEVVWELQVFDPTPAPVEEGDPEPVSFFVYRSEFLPGLYAGQGEE